MKGFKSFAEATSLELEPGVTVVVGPNGSGKSNVVDAIAWVLGAQAPSSVRSQKMDDVIFAGTSKRSALGRAEVELTIDNASGMLPVEFTEVKITRTLFRSGDSEYAINGVPCRLLDIQDLLSDSGVGRQQHVIISQGQIDAVLNSRPEDRRLVIEEAAGVLKFRKRKEKSERRLAATEGNITRLTDLLREVRRQLRPLERQAEAARRHGSVVAELTALRIFEAGRELTTLHRRLETAASSRHDLVEAERVLKGELARLDTAVMATEARLTAMGGDDLGDSLVQFESLFQQARGLQSLLVERRRGIERDRNAFVDQGVVATLEAEAAGLRTELAAVKAEEADLGPRIAELSTAENELNNARAGFEREWADGVPVPSGEAAEVRGELAALRTAISRGEAETDRIRARLAALGEKRELLTTEATRLREDLAAAEVAELPMVEALDVAERKRQTAEEALVVAEASQANAESEHRGWSARAEALRLALDEARSKAGAERLAGIDGVLGTLLDLVDVDSGWESAFEAAVAEALGAVVVDGPATARAALEALHAESISGAVLAIPGKRSKIGDLGATGSLRAHVRALRPDVDALLDVLVGGALVVDGSWSQALDVAMANPGTVVVTKSGDRFGATGWRVGQAGAGATGAALEDAQQRTDAAAIEVELARGKVTAAVESLAATRRVEAELSGQLDENDGRMVAASDALQRVETDLRDVSTEFEGLETHVGEQVARLDQERGRAEVLEVRLPELETDEAARLEAGNTMARARAVIEEQATTVGALRSDIEVRSAAVAERKGFLTKRLEELDRRLERSEAERISAQQRREVLDRRQEVTDRLIAQVIECSGVIEGELTVLRQRRQQQSEAAKAVTAELDLLRRSRSEHEKQLAETRERLQRVELDDAEVRLRIETAVEALRRDLDCEPSVAMAAECPPLDEGTNPKARIRELERDLRIMGPINPLALEEFEALSERHDFLQGQLDDVKESRRELNKIIKAIDAEIVNVFASAFADVAMNFEMLFSTLFPGGEGRLKLTEPDNLLTTGIEVEAKPSGKNVRKLSLLSGGERSLTALAFLFAVFRSRPSPFYVMDEVEAALDDVNLHRFLGLVDEFRSEAQLVIVSHQKRTMEAADCLYGVTMQPGGSSKVVSEKVGS